MKIMSLDASTKSTGVAIFDKDTKQLLDFKCITSSSTDLIKRIYKMRDEIFQLIKSNPEINTIIVEEVRPEGIKTKATVWKALTYLQAAIVFMVHDNFPKIKIEYILPNSWRSKCGIHTGAGVKRESLKQADITFVKDKYNIDVNDDIADAIGIGYSYLVEQSLLQNNEEINWA